MRAAIKPTQTTLILRDLPSEYTPDEVKLLFTDGGGCKLPCPSPVHFRFDIDSWFDTSVFSIFTSYNPFHL